MSEFVAISVLQWIETAKHLLSTFLVVKKQHTGKLEKSESVEMAV